MAVKCIFCAKYCGIYLSVNFILYSCEKGDLHDLNIFLSMTCGFVHPPPPPPPPLPHQITYYPCTPLQSHPAHIQTILAPTRVSLFMKSRLSSINNFRSRARCYYY